MLRIVKNQLEDKMSTAKTKEYLTVPEAANLLNISKNAVLVAIKTKKLNAKRDGYYWKIPIKTLQAYKALRKKALLKSERVRGIDSKAIAISMLEREITKTGFKNIKIDHLESVYSRLNKTFTSSFTNAQVKAFAISAIPRFAIELLLFISVISVVFYVIYTGTDASALAPKFAVFVVAAVKLLPAIQQLYGSISGLSFAYGSVKEISQDLESVQNHKNFEHNYHGKKEFRSCDIEKLNFSVQKRRRKLVLSENNKNKGF